MVDFSSSSNAYPSPSTVESFQDSCSFQFIILSIYTHVLFSQVRWLSSRSWIPLFLFSPACLYLTNSYQSKQITPMCMTVKPVDKWAVVCSQE